MTQNNGSELALLDVVSVNTALTDESAQKSFLDGLRQKANEFEADLTSVKGRKEIASFAHKVGRCKSAISHEKERLNADHKEAIAGNNSAAKLLTQEIQGIQDQVRKPLTDWENKEKLRLENLQNAIRKIQECISQIPMMTLDNNTHSVKGSYLDATHSITEWGEFEAKKNSLCEEFVDKFKQKLEQLKEQEREREEAESAKAELAAMKAAESERLKKERDAQIAKDAAENAKAAAEADAEAAADEKAKIEAQEAAKKADKDHRAKIHNEILNRLSGYFNDKNSAKAFIAAIAQGKIKNVTINY